MGIIKKSSIMFQLEAILKKLLIYLSIAVILFGVGYLALLNHKDFEEAIVKQTQEQLMLIAKSEAQSIQSYISDINDELEIAGSQPITHEVLKNETTVENKTVSSLLKDTYRDVGRLVDSVYLINAKGVVINASNPLEGVTIKDLSGEIDIKEVLQTKKPYTSAVFNLASGARVIAHTHPIMENGELIGLIRALILVDKINTITSHINTEGLSTLVIDSNGFLLSFPNEKYVGSKMDAAVVSEYPKFNFAEFDKNLVKMQRGESGRVITEFIFQEKNPAPKRTIMSFCPIYIDEDVWSISVFTAYDRVSGPINRNLRDNAIFVGFIILVFIIIARVLYSIHKKKDKLEIEKIALDIINRELHADIRERKRIEEEVQKQLGNKKPRPGNS